MTLRIGSAAVIRCWRMARGGVNGQGEMVQWNGTVSEEGDEEIWRGLNLGFGEEER